MSRLIIIIFFMFFGAFNTWAKPDMAADFKELMTAIKAVSPAEGSAQDQRLRSSVSENPVVKIGPQTITFSLTQPLAFVQTKFVRDSGTIDESVQVKQGLETKCTRFILDNENKPLAQALLTWEGHPVQVYDREDETFVYMQMPDKSGGIKLKEWIYARQPNCAQGTCLNWKIEGEGVKAMPPVNYWTNANAKMKPAPSLKSPSSSVIVHEPLSSYPLLIDPTLSWGQWLGGTTSDNIDVITVNGSNIYAGGFSSVSTGWNNQNVTFQGVAQGSINSAYVVKITDNGATPKLTWGQWLGGTGLGNQIFGLSTNSSSIYAGGLCTLSTGWNNQTVTFQGVSQGADAFVVKIMDNGTTPTLKWGQWLGGTGAEHLQALVSNGSIIYAGGYGSLSTGWNNQTVTFQGVAQGATFSAWVLKVTDNGTTPTLNWGQWLGGTLRDQVNALTINGSSIYAGGLSFLSTGWNNQGATFAGVEQGSTTNGFVVKITDNGATPTLNWGQWLGGINTDSVTAIANNGSSIYAGGFSAQSTGWNNQTVTFQGVEQGSTDNGFVVKITDNGATPTLNWGQWLGGIAKDQVNALAINGSSIYAGGLSTQSTGWNNQTVTFTGVEQGGTQNGFVVKITDNGATPTLKWGQWMGGTASDKVTTLTINGLSIYAGGISTLSTGWNNQSVTFQGVEQGTTQNNFVTKECDGASTSACSGSLWYDGMGF